MPAIYLIGVTPFTRVLGRASERSEGSLSSGGEMLRCAQHDNELCLGMIQITQTLTSNDYVRKPLVTPRSFVYD
jgi:hypothetical protein